MAAGIFAAAFGAAAFVGFGDADFIFGAEAFFAAAALGLVADFAATGLEALGLTVLDFAAAVFAAGLVAFAFGATFAAGFFVAFGAALFAGVFFVAVVFFATALFAAGFLATVFAGDRLVPSATLFAAAAFVAGFFAEAFIGFDFDAGPDAALAPDDLAADVLGVGLLIALAMVVPCTCTALLQASDQRVALFSKGASSGSLFSRLMRFRHPRSQRWGVASRGLIAASDRDG